MVGAVCVFALFFGLLHIALPQDIPTIRPEQLLIATVIDVASSEIVRDAINLLKSIRIFGGSINQATILVGVIGQQDKALLDDDLLSTLVALDAEIHFLSSVTGSLAKTLNKFKAFDVFDSTKYDYFLWLDADIVLFRDPMPFLHMHKYPGEIGCVPDFYSYMRRFPSVNQSAEYWNPALSTSYLLGEGEVAPNGICNTGVLFYDSLSLSTFKEGLHQVLKNETYMNLHGKDRFVDSLIFTKVVNEMAIEVTIMPYSMNYMALFEIELQEEIILTDIVFAHFVSDTELYCTNAVENDCSCVYRNKLLPAKESLVRDTVQRLILSNVSICQMFAGVHMPPRPAAPERPAAVSVPNASPFTPLVLRLTNNGAVEEHREGDAVIQCGMITPPVSDWIVHSSSSEAPILIDIAVKCAWNPGLPTDKVKVSTTIIAAADGTVVHKSVVDSSPVCHTSECAVAAVFTVSLASPPRAHAKTVYQLKIALSPDGDDLQRSEIESTFIVVEDELVPPGQINYSNNLLLSTKSLALESQLMLPEFLNARVLRGTGVAVCCGTHKGLATVKRLIEHWRGEQLLIIVEAAPPALAAAASEEPNAPIALRALAAELAAHCDTHKRPGSELLCVVSAPTQSPVLLSALPTSVPHSRRLSTAMRSGSANFVFIDAKHSYDEQRVGLLEWSRVLSKYGVLFGTQYGLQRLFSDLSHSWSRPARSKDSNQVTMRNGERASFSGVVDASSTEEIRSSAQFTHTRLAVNFLAEQLGQHVLATYLERDPLYCAHFTALHRDGHYGGGDQGASSSSAELERAAQAECSPAWYLVKQGSQR